MYVHCSPSGSDWVVLRRRGVGVGSSLSAVVLALRLLGVGGVSSSDPEATVARRLLAVVGGVSSSDWTEVVALRLLGVVFAVSSAWAAGDLLVRRAGVDDSWLEVGPDAVWAWGESSEPLVPPILSAALF